MAAHDLMLREPASNPSFPGGAWLPDSAADACMACDAAFTLFRLGPAIEVGSELGKVCMDACMSHSPGNRVDTSASTVLDWSVLASASETWCGKARGVSYRTGLKGHVMPRTGYDNNQSKCVSLFLRLMNSGGSGADKLLICLAQVCTRLPQWVNRSLFSRVKVRRAVPQPCRADLRSNTSKLLSRRRHHCRSCGRLFCDRCSPWRAGGQILLAHGKLQVRPGVPNGAGTEDL